MSVYVTQNGYHSGLLREARQSAHMTLRELAEKAGTSHATLSAYEQGKKVPSITTFLRILESCGNAVDIRLHRRVRTANGIPRGDELVSVLRLASQFPSKASRQLELPVFPDG